MGRRSINYRSNKKFKNSLRGPNKRESDHEKPKQDGKNCKGEKKIWSLEGLVEAMKPTSEELDYRKEKSLGLNPAEKYSKLFKCTKCQKNLKPSIEQKRRVPVHSCLGVLMCDECRAFYEGGEFSADSDGEDKYCRWCGEGGTIITCSQCISGFCADCIKFHFSLKFYKELQKNENWLCFFCDPKPLWHERYICSLAEQLCNEIDTSVPSWIISKRGHSKITRKRPHELSTSDDDAEEIGPLKSPLKKFKLGSTPLRTLINQMDLNLIENSEGNLLHELQKLLKSSEYQMSFGVAWCQETLKKLSRPDIKLTQEDLVNECRRIKLVLSVLSTYLVQFCNSVDSLEKNLHQEEGGKASDSPEKHQPPYTTILKFLGFCNNQVRTFIQKGITFSELLEAPVYDDDKVIGIKKRSYLAKRPVESDNSKLDLTNEEDRTTASKEDEIVASKKDETIASKKDKTIARKEDGSIASEEDRSITSKEDKELSKGTSRGEGSVELEINQRNAVENDNNNPQVSLKGATNSKTSESDEIQKLLSILEYA